MEYNRLSTVDYGLYCLLGELSHDVQILRIVVYIENMKGIWTMEYYGLVYRTMADNIIYERYRL